MPKAKGRNKTVKSLISPKAKSSRSPRKGIQKAQTSSKTLSAGNRQSKRLQQQKITESWPEIKAVREKRKNGQSPGATEVEIVKNITVSVPIILEANTVPVAKPKADISTPLTSVVKISRLHSLSREEKLEILKNFDLQGLYGPCRGMPRLSRFKRARQFNILPKPDDIIQEILETHRNENEFEKCIWDCNELLRVKVVGSPMKKKP